MGVCSHPRGRVWNFLASSWQLQVLPNPGLRVPPPPTLHLCPANLCFRKGTAPFDPFAFSGVPVPGSPRLSKARPCTVSEAVRGGAGTPLRRLDGRWGLDRVTGSRALGDRAAHRRERGPRAGPSNTPGLRTPSWSPSKAPPPAGEAGVLRGTGTAPGRERYAGPGARKPCARKMGARMARV